MTTEQASEGQFVKLVADNDYEINDTYLHQIRRIDNKAIKEPYQANRYFEICLNGQHYKLHRLIAQNFILNPDNLNEVDHVNRD
ncbi:MAG: hypothetical protein EZS28_009355 [Streblomastix strix]|uniref:HNH nuclease domain-containing protein n=1 Tax=Streblomastix strix TaxID=222440 RepID=A0A5J4WKH2_9EUKA|nr:MAG: hypothetical protein EZS28_009355 [Streblomastix strix]